jgi:ribosome maturation factor RimP
VRATSRLRETLARAVAGLGYELVEVELLNGGKLLRVFIDKPHGVSVNDCARVSHHLTRLLAVEDVDYGRLEVSSPGFDRPLTREADFVRFAGEKARLKLRVPIEGRRQIVGILRGLREGIVNVEADGSMFAVPFDNLERARLVPKH